MSEKQNPLKKTGFYFPAFPDPNAFLVDNILRRLIYYACSEKVFLKGISPITAAQ